jgi:hypothetical protein
MVASGLSTNKHFIKNLFFPSTKSIMQVPRIVYMRPISFDVAMAFT